MPTFLMPLIDGFEETEAVTPIDYMRRAGIEVVTAGINDSVVTSSHQVKVVADALWKDVSSKEFDGICIPGGPGVKELNQVPGLHELLRNYNDQSRWIAAICAAPSILARAGILNDRPACCFPSVEEHMTETKLRYDPVVRHENVITSRGAGTTVPFALEIIAAVLGTEKSEEIAKQTQYPTAFL